MPLPEEPEKELSLWFEKTATVENKDGVYEFWWNRNHASKGGSTRDPVMIDGFWEDPEPNLFLSSLSESRGRDSF